MSNHLRLDKEDVIVVRRHIFGKPVNEFRAGSVFHIGWEGDDVITLWSKDPKLTLSPFGDPLQTVPRARLIAKMKVNRLRGTKAHKAIARHIQIQIGHGHGSSNVDLGTLEPLPGTAPKIDESLLSEDDLASLHVLAPSRRLAARLRA